MHRAIRAINLAVGLSLLTGCAANFRAADFQGLRQASVNEYEVFYEDHKGIFGSEASLQDKVVSDANAFAERQGMVTKPEEARQHRVGILGDWAWAYYKFGLVPKGDITVSKRAVEITFEADARMSNNFLATNRPLSTETHKSTQTKYEELTKLDELRKQGILTEEEFQTQKKLILEK